MKQIWGVINIALIILGLWGGYNSMSPEQLRQTNPDAILCFILLVAMPLFVICSVCYSIYGAKCETLRRPSWNRCAFNWWYDPLQSLFLTTCFMAAMAISSALRFPALGSIGFWTFAMYFCISGGLLMGQIVVYCIFRARIKKAE